MPTLPAELRTAPWKDRAGRLSGLKAVIFLLLHVPAAWMFYDLMNGRWMIPVVGLIYWSGVWATFLLLVTLLITPLRRIFQWRKLIIVRRMVGVGALAYSFAHLLFYFWLRQFDGAEIAMEVVTRFTLIVATISLIGLTALGLTSFDAAIRRMGAKNWARLHRTTYIATGLAVFHFLLSPGATGGMPFLMVGAYFWLMAWRYFDRRKMGAHLGVLASLGAAATVLTVALEAIWPAIFFDMDPWISLSFNFSLILGLSPGWQILLMSTVLVLGAAWVQRRKTALA